MNHRNGVKKIGKDHDHKLSLLKNLAENLFRHEKIKTTIAKGRLLKSFAEPLIERAKTDNLHNRRQVYRSIRNTDTLKKLFENIAKRYTNRHGGYTRMLKLNVRKGDAGEWVLVELVEESLTSNAKVETTKAAEVKETPVATPAV